MNPVIVIPTFVSARRLRENAPVLTTYDHMTPLTSDGELPRCLESLRKVRGLGEIIILVVSERTIEERAANKIREVAQEFADLNISVIGAPEMEIIRQRVEQLGVVVDGEIGLAGYSAVRNLGLLLANAGGFDAVVFVDDDEVIDDDDFLERAMYGLGKQTRRGVPILAKTGYYINSKGTYYSLSQDKWYNRFWEQGKTFNQWISHAMQGPRLSRSNHVCGGCLALHSQIFMRVAFDPWIPRGEDLDYLLNLRMHGFDVWFDNKWELRHLPPDTAREGLRFRQDIFRWLYEYRKVEYARTQIDLMQIKPHSLQPYPGPFLEPGLTKRVKRTALLRSIGRPDASGYRKAARSATTDAARYAEDHCMKYFAFQRLWPAVMQRMSNDTVLRQVLMSASNQGQQRFEELSSQGWSGGVNPGMTSEIRLNLGSEE